MPRKKEEAALFRFLLVVACACFGVVEARAAETWHVAKVIGSAVVLTGGAGTPVTVGLELADGQTLATGPAGRVLLVKGAASMLLGPGTSMAVQPNPNDDGKTVALQRSGSLELEVEKRNVRYFSVETPYLAAVVKGTHFKVAVGRGRTSVGVTRGLVEVDAFRTGQRTMVPPGQVATATVKGLAVSGTGAKYEIVSMPIRAPTVSAASATSAAAADDASDVNADDTAADDGKPAKPDKPDKGDKGGSGGGNGKGNNGNGGGNGGGKGNISSLPLPRAHCLFQSLCLGEVQRGSSSKAIEGSPGTKAAV